MQPGKVKGPPAPVVAKDLWRELYAAASHFYQLAPWDWMEDVHILGIEDERGMRLHCVLGAREEVFGLASYRGEAGVRGLFGLLSGEVSPDEPDAGFAMDSLLMDFVPRKGLRKEDLALIRELGFKPLPGAPQRFPEFYSHKPGYVPWFLEEAEVRLELDDLAKVSRFAELLRNAPGLYAERAQTEFPFFPAKVKEPLSLDQFTWRVVSASPAPEDPVASLDGLPALSALPRAEGATWELTAFHAMIPIGEGPRPYWPKLGVAVDSESGMILAYKLSGPTCSMSRAAALGLQEAMRKCGNRPARIQVSSETLQTALGPLARELSITLELVEELPMADEARYELESGAGLG